MCLAYVETGDSKGLAALLQKLDPSTFLNSVPNVEIAKNNFVFFLVRCAQIASDASVPMNYVSPLYRRYLRAQRLAITIDDVRESAISAFIDFTAAVEKHGNSLESGFAHSVRQLLVAHLTDGTTLNDLANQCNMSLSNLQHRFKRESGETLTQAIRKIKVEKACQLLQEGTLSCAEIATKLDFCSQSYFSKYFKEVIGVSPREFQKSCKSMHFDWPNSI